MTLILKLQVVSTASISVLLSAKHVPELTTGSAAWAKAVWWGAQHRHLLHWWRPGWGFPNFQRIPSLITGPGLHPESKYRCDKQENTQSAIICSNLTDKLASKSCTIVPHVYSDKQEPLCMAACLAKSWTLVAALPHKPLENETSWVEHYNKIFFASVLLWKLWDSLSEQMQITPETCYLLRSEVYSISSSRSQFCSTQLTDFTGINQGVHHCSQLWLSVSNFQM